MSTTVEQLIQQAKQCGFDEAAPLDVSTLHAREDVRAMCAENKCGAYGTTWSCPPACGSLEECADKMAHYKHGVLVQTVGALSKAIDSKAYQEIGERHRDALLAFADEVRKVSDDTLVLGAGTCNVCSECAYPDPCRFPDKAISSMEAYGLFVTQVCRDNNVDYYHGPKTIAYTACVLYN